jgi:hypothetical protein
MEKSFYHRPKMNSPQFPLVEICELTNLSMDELKRLAVEMSDR